MKVPFLASLLLTCIRTCLGGAPEKDETLKDPLPQMGSPHAEAQVQWLRANGGYFHRKLEVRHLNRDDPTSPMGVFALEDLPEKETLIILPQACLLTSEGSHDICDTARNLMKQRQLGNESFFSAYVNYLFDGNHKGQLPAAWSKTGQTLLQAIIGEDMPPYDVTGLSFENDCGGSGDPFEEEAYHLVVRRSWDDKMLPVFDMCNHRNGKWFNVDSNSAHTGEDVKVFARRAIKAGEQLYLSYNECADCDFAHTYVLQHIIKDFGFIEQYPRRWRFPVDEEEALVFEIDEKSQLITNSTEIGELELRWLNGIPDADEIQVLRDELKRVRELSAYVAVQAEMLASDHERSVSLEFYQALITALEYAIRTADPQEEHEGECSISADGNLGSCENPTAVRREYDDLEQPSETIAYNEEVCDFDEIHRIRDEFYETSDHTESQYSDIQFEYSKEMKDTCLILNDHLQACASFRPHYHEVFVHYPARYVKEVKRVAFIGGGDNMIVHEILKYPSLELVVGMELDHQIVRSSFKNFGTQPHWDDERLQWWYGDGTKSLLVLPQEYYGTFDLVLLDLQTEVVEMLKVTEELNVMEAAMLLLKPDGVIARNEDWNFGTSNPFTDYAVDLYYVDLPVICAQGITMGSNTVDFLRRKPIDHKIDTIYLKPIHEAEDRFDFWFNYRKSNTSVDAIPKFPEWNEDVIGSPGLLMVLEAENTTVPLKSPSSIQASISTALKKAGLTEIAVKVSTPTDWEGYEIAFILEQGYVVARTWPQHDYCAFDLLLWSGFDKLPAAETELIAAFGSKTASSYRLVTGGMFGTSKENVGPRINEWGKQQAEEKRNLAKETPSEQSTIDAVLGESMSLLPSTNARVAVLCGEQVHPCRSLEALATKKIDVKAIPIWTCPGITAAAAQENPKSMLDCELDTLRSLLAAVEADGKISGLVIDPDATLAMGQIFLKIFSVEPVRLQLLSANPIVLSTSINSSGSAWRRAFLDRFRTDFAVFAPAHRAEVLFNDTGLELGVFSFGDATFYSHLMDVVARIESSTSLVSEVRSVKNGLHDFIEDFQPSKTFSHDSYDRTSALEQWTSQRPLGEQVIYKFTAKTSLSTEKLKTALHDTLVAMKMLDEEHIEVYNGVGDGCVLVSFWSRGSVIVSWDGRTDVTVNLFFELPRPIKSFGETFADELGASMSSMDDFPRGIGRVVNFLADIMGSPNPNWAS